MILVDSNVPLYVVGQPHRHKVDAQRLLERCLAERERLVTDAEAFQAILHRYVAIQRRDAIQPAFDLLLGLVDEVFPITVEDVQRAREIVVGVVPLSARDAIHVAVMERNGIGRILSFDRGFDALPTIKRIAD